MKSTSTGIKRILKAFTYSYDGFKSTFKSEAAFRQDLVFCLIMTIIALSMDISVLQKANLIASLLIILLMELVNTAIETVIDRISEEYNELSKKAKDIGSLLVLIAFIYVALIWLPVIYNLFI